MRQLIRSINLAFFFCPLRGLQWKATLNPGFRTMTARTDVLTRLLIIDPHSALSCISRFVDYSVLFLFYCVNGMTINHYRLFGPNFLAEMQSTS